jgi:hypothetical protein
MKKNPFEELGITVRPEALFQDKSNDGTQIDEKRESKLLRELYVQAMISMKQ